MALATPRAGGGGVLGEAPDAAANGLPASSPSTKAFDAPVSGSLTSRPPSIEAALRGPAAGLARARSAANGEVVADPWAELLHSGDVPEVGGGEGF